jgi:hypothetical protein
VLLLVDFATYRAERDADVAELTTCRNQPPDTVKVPARERITAPTLVASL